MRHYGIDRQKPYESILLRETPSPHPEGTSTKHQKILPSTKIQQTMRSRTGPHASLSDLKESKTTMVNGWEDVPDLDMELTCRERPREKSLTSYAHKSQVRTVLCSPIRWPMQAVI